MSIKVGDRVAWESQAMGSTTRKEGVVVATRDQAGPGRFPGSTRSPRDFVHDTGLTEGRRIMFDGYTSWGYSGLIVEVCDGKTDRAKPKLYMPNVQVEKIGGAE